MRTSSPLWQIFLQLIICGLGKIDVSDWKANTRLKHCTPDSNVVKWFWKAVELFDEERRARLLQFVTGSSRVPLQGFKALQGEVSREGAQVPCLHSCRGGEEWDGADQCLGYIAVFIASPVLMKIFD